MTAFERVYTYQDIYWRRGRCVEDVEDVEDSAETAEDTNLFGLVEKLANVNTCSFTWLAML